jgi:hypothetical protein
MKTGKLLLVIISILFVFSLTACAQQSTPTPPPDNAPASTTLATGAVQSSQTAPTAAADGETLIREKLQNHHDIERILNASKTRDEWNTTLDRMIAYGANISDAEKQAIIDYLLSR